jgi:Flp pilus assembly protein TadG
VFYKRLEDRRLGVIAPLTGILMIFLVGMVAFAVDMGWIVLSQTNLQNAADAAALAGVQPLMNGYVQYSIAQTSAAQTAALASAQASAKALAKQYAGYNSAGTIKSLTLNDSDIQFGYTDAKNNYSTKYTGFPNTIKVTLRLDNSANGSLSLFFAPVLGSSSTSLNASAAATIYTGQVNSLTPSSGLGLLPVTYDVNHWNNFVKTGLSPDGTTFTDTNGIPELQVYPSLKTPGTFGQLSLNDSHVGASTEIGWVNSGPAASDIQALIDNNLIPLSGHDPTKWDWLGNTGMKTSLISAINSQAGNTYLLPLFTPVSTSPYQPNIGVGSHTSYNIVQFVGITIMPQPSGASGVWIEPAAMLNTNFVFTPGSITPAGTAATFTDTFTTPKLSQ